MKRKLLTFALFLAFIIVGCSNTNAAETVSASQALDVAGAEPGEVPRNENMLLAFGMFALEDSAVPVTAAQAADLLRLWRAADALSESDTITAEEYQAVFNQIKATLTAEQMGVIEELDMTSESTLALAEEYGLTLGFGPGSGGDFDPENLSPEQQATIEAIRESGEFPGGGAGPGGGFPEGGFPGGGPGGGGFPEGGFPGGGFGPGGGGDIGSLPEAQQTAIASGTARRAAAGLPPGFFDAVIAFLEGKVE